jgi:hypothetical protein
MRNTHHAHGAHDLHLLSHPMLWTVAVAGAIAMSSSAHAAPTTPDDLVPPANAVSMTPREAYAHDRAFCNSGQATEARALCLKEAARAYHDDLAGKLVRPDEAEAMGARDRDRAATSGTGTDSDARWHNGAAGNGLQGDRTQDRMSVQPQDAQPQDAQPQDPDTPAQDQQAPAQGDSGR